MALNILPQGSSRHRHSAQVQFLPQLVQHSRQTARSLEIRHAVLAVGPDADQQGNFTAGLRIDGAAIHVQAGLCGHGRDVNDGIRGASDSHADTDRVGNRPLRNDIPGTDVLLPQLHHLPSGLPAEVDQIAGHGGQCGVARQGHTDGLRQQAHGVGGSHHAAGSAAGRTGVNQLFKLLLRQFALFHLGDAGADIDKVHVFAVHHRGLHVSACDDYCGDIHPSRRHQQRRNHLVTGPNQHHRIQIVRLGVQLNLIHQQVPAGKHIVSATYAVAEVDAVEQEGKPPTFNNALPGGVRQAPLVDMTGVDFVPGVHDAYPGLFNIRIVVSQSIEKCPGSLPVQRHPVLQIAVNPALIVAHNHFLSAFVLSSTHRRKSNRFPPVRAADRRRRPPKRSCVKLLFLLRDRLPPPPPLFSGCTGRPTAHQR